MNRILLLGACLALIPAAAGRAAAGETAPLQVVTTTSDLKSLAEAIGGERVRVTALATGQEDPHFLQAKPSYMMAARRADLWIRVGLELEIGYEQLILDGSRNARIRVGAPGHLDASQGVLRLEVPTERVDRSHGDVHPLGNPHYWLDPWNGRIMAGNICERLCRLDPASEAGYRARCAAFVRRLDEAMFGPELAQALGGDELWRRELAGDLDRLLEQRPELPRAGGWKGALAPHRGAAVVTYHRSWSYFVNRFGLQVVAELEPQPGIPPTPGHLAEVISAAQEAHARLLLVEPFYETRGPRFVAERAGLQVVVAANSTGGQEEAADYLAMLDNVVRRAAAALAAQAGTAAPAAGG